jgi:ethanolamine ammonia-lyase small subunit
MSDPVTRPGWSGLRQYTGARIALGRVGAGLPTSAHLQFQLAHARARDAVHTALDNAALLGGLQERGEEAILLHSAAMDRREYLLRPDLGRCLDDASRKRLAPLAVGCDVVFVIADGLSAMAVNQHALPFLDTLLPTLRNTGWRIGPISLVEQGRVGVGDAIGQALKADLVVVLIGERPGLSAPDSLGAYLTWQPNPGVTTDAERNCISNIRHEGLAYPVAAARLLYLMNEARQRRLSGVALKEEADLTQLLKASDL